MKWIHLISGPRNISTSLMYSFNNRKDCQGVDEPFYAHYLKHTGLNHPGRDIILASMETNEQAIIHNLETMKSDAPFLFIKNMASHVALLESNFYYESKNLFLIRNTDDVINSFAKVVSDFTLNDIGIKQEYEIYKKLVSHGQNPPIIDSNELLKKPDKILEAACKQMSIPFEPNMLHWEAGPKTIDGIWAEHWYGNTHKSTGFSKTIPSDKKTVPDSMKELALEAKKYYEALFELSLKA